MQIEEHMPHIIFIHGVSNKPESDYLHRLWRRKLTQNSGLDLDTNNVNSSMVYWADVLYPNPDTDLASYEAETSGLELIKSGVITAEIDHYVFSLKPGRIIFEMDGISESLAREALSLADAKLPIKTKFVKRHS